MREKLARFMYGRYGNDGLNRFLSVIVIICLVLGLITKLFIFTVIALVFLVLQMARTMSRNIYKRAAENNKYLELRQKVLGLFSGKKNQYKQSKTHRIYKCSACGQKVRVPKGRGRIQITCPKCGNQFIKTT